ncbi:hypothetical protein HK101_011772 [Irineochytrium annulatum]|nr:hypothetical protein HK101_011772 [Irineochytrium annulatum]
MVDATETSVPMTDLAPASTDEKHEKGTPAASVEIDVAGAPTRGVVNPRNLELPENIYYNPDGKFTKDSVIHKFTLVCFIALLVSWTATLCAFALPYWRQDQYNHGGFFTICGTADVVFSPTNGNTSGLLVTTNTHEPRCTTVDTWIDNLLASFHQYDAIDDINPTKTRLQFEASISRGDIHAGLFLEILRLFLSMFFGLGTFYHICYPLTLDRQKSEVRRGMLCLLGIYLTPTLIIINIIVALKYWEYIGVGYFDQSANGYFGPCAQVMVGTGMVDLVLQFAYFQWGVKRQKLKIQGRIDSEESVKVEEDVDEDVRRAAAVQRSGVGSMGIKGMA